MSKKYADLTGMQFGRWTVMSEDEPVFYGNTRVRYWKCQCECGTVRRVKEESLKSGKSNSCGCYHSDVMRGSWKWKTTHGQTDTRLYRIYRHMINRCTNPNDVRYDKYGGRGISVCDEWSTFEGFYKWAVGAGYRDDLSIDRIDNDKGYCPDNCRWATNDIQANNKSNVIMLEYGGKKQSIAAWANELGMPYKKLHKRIYNGWDVERALFT